MQKKERIKKILNFFKKNEFLKVGNILDLFKNEIDRTTIYRDIQDLIEKNEIEEISSGKYQIKENPKKFLKKFYLDRTKKFYNKKFLENYIPNKTSFLGIKNYNKIQKAISGKNILSTMDYLKNRRGIETLLIDLSYTSSKMEGNTYSYLDTEVLIKYNEEAKGKTQFETQMVLNHKNAINFIIENKDLEIKSDLLFRIHFLLGKNLIHDDYLGKIRNNHVKIGGSQYQPLDNFFQLKEEFEKFLEKLNQIKNPFEQSLFILIFIPYFQIFFDINKRTSRISANIPLISNGLSPISLLQIKERDYVEAILAIYELNDVSLMAKLFTENYILNFDRYIVS